MSASDDQVHDPVLAATDPVISHEVPVPVDDQILKDVSNLGSNGTPESVAAGLISLHETDASNGAVGPTTSADEKENAPSHEQPASVEGGVFVDDKGVIVHGSDIALEKTKDVQDASGVEVDNAASDSITTDNVDDTTLNEKDNEIIAVKDIPNTSEVESVPAVEYGTRAESDLIAPVANITEANTDDSVNDSAIENPARVLEKKQGCAKDDEDDAAPADGVKLVETGNHNDAVQMDKRDAADSVDDNPEVMNQAPNGEIAEVALQEKGNVDADITSNAAEGDALDIDAVPETKEEDTAIAIAEAPESNVSDSVVAQVDAADSVEPAASMKDILSSDHVESAAAETQVDEPRATVEDIVEQAQDGDAPAVAPVVEAAPTEADLQEDGAVVATEQDEFDETSAEPTNILDAKPRVEEVEVGHEVEPAAEDVETITPETTNGEASAKVEVESVSADREAPVDEPVTTEAVAEVGNEEGSVQVKTEPVPTPVDEPIVPVAESEVPREGAAACVEAEPLPAGEVITAPVESEEVAQTSEAYEEAPITIEVHEVQYKAENFTEEANEETTASVFTEPVAETEEVTAKASEVETAGHDGVTQEAPGSVEPESIPAGDEVAIAVVEVTEEHVPAPIELSEETSATTVNVENEEIPAPVDALEETTVVEAEGAPIEAPVEVPVAASLEAKYDATGEAAGEGLTTATPEAAVLQATHTETPGEIALNTEPSTTVAEDEAVAEETPAPVVDAPETPQEALATLETSKSPPPIIEAENAGTSQDAESVPQPDEGASVPIAPLAAEIAPIEIAREFVVDEEKVAVEESTNAPVVDVKENVPELRTSAISIETSLDTTPFTPILDSGIGFKEQEAASSTLSSIAEELERPKSSWRSSSFQVSTVGGVESSGVGDTGPVPESTELAETDEPASTPLLVVEDTPINDQVPTIGASEEFISVDQASLEQPPGLWSTSYSVHSQGIAENFSIDGLHEPKEPATAAHALPLEEQGELASIPVEGFTAEVINHNKSSEQIIEDATSTVGSHVPSGEEADQVSEPAPEASEEVTGKLEVSEEDAKENVDQEANQEVEAKLTVDNAPARPWTPSYSAHSQGIPPVATKELGDDPPEGVMTVSAEWGIESYVENVDSEHDKTVDEQNNTAENEVYGQLSTEAKLTAHSQGIPPMATKELGDDPPEGVMTVSAEWGIESYVENVDSEHDKTVDEQINTTENEVYGQLSTEVSHANPVIEETLDPQQSSQAETNPNLENELPPSSVEQSQNNNIGKVVAAAIAPVIALAALGAGSQGLGSVADEEAPHVDATLTVDTTAVSLLPVPSEVVDGDATDTNVDALERPRSPWTPSYSVTKQGASLSQEEEAEEDHLEPLSPTAAQVGDSEPQLNEVQEDEPASNALQTRPSYAVAGTEEIAKNEQFFLFGLRAIVAYLWVLPKWLSMTPSDHSRRGSSSSSTSSSSSKFFPGGWFSPKPNEGHTSLDVAQGEFASSPKVTTSNDAFETLGSEATDSSAAVNVTAEDYGQKRKWCVVM